VIDENGVMGTYMITGATGGIGAALAAKLHDRGHDLILTGRSAERLAAASAEHGGARTLVLDLADPARLAGSLGETELPSLDGLVHSAGALELGTVEQSTVADWVEQLMVNVAGPAELTRLLLPALRAADGHVIFVNSGSGLRANPGWGAYSASKHGERALADALRAEEPGIRVTSVYPGRTATEMQRKVRTHEEGDYEPSDYMSPHTVAGVIMNALETPRDATVHDVSVRG
jgi:NADP-dependent 3-hydroxy acid dehydrogenase YdfG